MPVPQKTFFLVKQASCLLQNLIKMTFARGLLAFGIKEANSQLPIPNYPFPIFSCVIKPDFYLSTNRFRRVCHLTD